MSTGARGSGGAPPPESPKGRGAEPSPGGDLIRALEASLRSTRTDRKLRRLRAARRAVANVLRFHLGETRATERANAFAIAVVEQGDDRLGRIAIETIRGYGLEDGELRAAAEKLCVAWRMYRPHLRLIKGRPAVAPAHEEV